MTSPMIAECARHVARDFYETGGRVAVRAGADPGQRASWEMLGQADRDQLIQTAYTMLYAGRIVCPLPDHRIRISLRDTQQTVNPG